MDASSPIDPFRHDLGVEPADSARTRYRVADPYRLALPLELSSMALWLAARFDGTATARDLSDLLRAEAGVDLPAEQVGTLAASLDDAFCLDSSRLAAFLNQPVRPPSCVGTYPEDPEQCAAVLTKLFTAEGGPGLPGRRGCRVQSDGVARAVLAPHMDYGRGGVCYGWALKEFWERTAAVEVFVVATSHYSPHRATLSRQGFSTPFGVLENASDVVERVAARVGPSIWADRMAHHPEHSIELEAVILQWLAARDGVRLRMVPLLVGSFGDCVGAGNSPGEADDVRALVEAMCAESGAAFLISGDLAHIGPKFDRSEPPIDDEAAARSRAGDELILGSMASGDAEDYRQPIWAEGDRRRICGMPPTWLTLAALRPGPGKVLHYSQARDPKGRESVSFAAAVWG